MHGIMGTLGGNVGNIRFSQLAFPQWAFVDVPPLSDHLLLMGGGLLLVAALLMGLQNRRRVDFENSPFRYELISYLSRIANAMERLEPRDSGQNATDLLRNLLTAKSSDKIREMPKRQSK